MAQRARAAEKGIETRRRNHAERFRPKTAEQFWQRKAHSMVSAAIRQGILPSLASGEYACTDCGQAATVYEHLDYASPLDVAPVCTSCNFRRGTAAWPAATAFRFKKIASPQREGMNT